MSDDASKGFFTYTQRDVANTALSVSSLAALGATAGTTFAPGPGSVVGGFVGGLAGLFLERFIDLKPPNPPREQVTSSTTRNTAREGTRRSFWRGRGGLRA
jgi:hypothetical protein